MTRIQRLSHLAAIFLLVVFMAPFAGPAWAESSAAEINHQARAALEKLYRDVPAAKALGKEAVGIMVFPNVIKGGFIIGGQYGDGALFKHTKTAGYYRLTSASYGLQAGAQTFGYALFFMTPSALRYLQESEGWEIGVGPSIVVMDEGLARNLTTTTAKEDIYAFVFGQEGLMAGLGIQGSKISRIHPNH